MDTSLIVFQYWYLNCFLLFKNCGKCIVFRPNPPLKGGGDIPYLLNIHKYLKKKKQKKGNKVVIVHSTASIELNTQLARNHFIQKKTITPEN